MRKIPRLLNFGPSANLILGKFGFSRAGDYKVVITRKLTL
jgi:hypothetical protein